MKKLLSHIWFCVCMLFPLCACTIKSNDRAGDEEINVRKAEFERYLEEALPGRNIYRGNMAGIRKDGWRRATRLRGISVEACSHRLKSNRFKIYTSDEDP